MSEEELAEYGAKITAGRIAMSEAKALRASRVSEAFKRWHLDNCKHRKIEND